jgi:hypothetical protein
MLLLEVPGLDDDWLRSLASVLVRVSKETDLSGLLSDAEA